MFTNLPTRPSRAIAIAPYVACVALVVFLLPIGHHPRIGELVAALAIQAVVGAGLMLGARRPWMAVAGVALYLLSVALLRDAGGSGAGYGALCLLPVIWSASTGRRRELILTLAGIAVVFAAPILLIGGDAYPATGWRAGGLAVAIGAGLGFAVLGLVRALGRQSRDLESILSAMSEGLVVTRDGRILAVNPAFCRMTGFTAGELVGARAPFAFWPPELREQTEELRRRVVETDGGEFEVTMMRAGGERFPVAVTATSTELGDGRRAFLNTARDITESHRHLTQLSALASVARAVGHGDPLDARRTVCRVALDVCPGADRATMWERLDDGTLISTAMEPSDGGTYVTADGPEHGARRALRSGAPVFVAGSVSVHFHPVAGADGVRGVLAIGFPRPLDALPADVLPVVRVLAEEAAIALQRADLLARLDELTRTDELTGLPNRRAWDDLLERELHAARRHGEPVSVAMLDLDHFKAYNDERGHLAGDRLLSAAAARWQDRLRLTDVLARWGGEEFAVLLPGCDADEAMAMVTRLRGTLPDGVTFSAGVAMWDGVDAPRTLVDNADRALYRAKQAGRDRVEAAGPRPLPRA